MDYNRIRRGMIFWKAGEAVETRDSKFAEDKSYPWVVVSSDQRNSKHHISIVPILRMPKPPKSATNYVGITFKNNPAYIMCDTIQTVQGSFLESSQYDGWITEEVMDKVSDQLRKSLDIEYSAKDLMSTSTAEQIEKVIDQIIQKKLAEARSSIPRAEIDDVAIKISENLETLFDVNSDSTEIEETITEETSPEPDVSEPYTEKEMPNKPFKNKWTQESIIEFLHKFDSATEDQKVFLVKEYHFKNMRSMIQTRRGLVKKLESMNA